MLLIFCVLVLHPTTLPDSPVSSNSLLVKCFGSLYKWSYHLQKTNSFTLPHFPLFVPLISFPCQIAITKTSGIILKNSGESGHPCMVLDLGEKAATFFSIQYDATSRFVTYRLNCVMVCSSCAQFSKVFFTLNVLYFIKYFV